MRGLLMVVVVAAVTPSVGCKGARTDLVGFEGEIVYDVKASGVQATYEGPSWSLVTEVKGDRVRMQAGPSDLPAIMDRPAAKGYLVSPSMRTYSEFELTPPPKRNAVVTKTGARDKVLGYECARVTVVEPGITRSEICVTRGVSLEGFGMKSVSRMTGGAGHHEALRDGIPLRIEIYDPDGKLEATILATSIEKKRIPDADFAPPPGYAKRP